MTTVTLPMHQRLGSCEPSLCGSACCQFIVIEANPIYLHQPDLASWVRLHRLELVERSGRTLVKIPLACSALTSDGRCSLYGTPERPQICHDYPMTPLSLLGVEDVCTYAFVGPEVAVTGSIESP